MRIRIDGREYPVIDHRSGAKLLHLVELREHTRALLEQPLGMGRLDELARAARILGRNLRAAEQAYAEAFADGVRGPDLEQLADVVRRLKAEQADDGLLGLAIVVFLSRRGAGDRVTFSQATTVDVSAIEWIPEPSDASVVPPDDGDDDPFGPATPDPTAPGETAAPASPETGVVAPRAASVKAVKRKASPASKGGRSTTSRSR